MGFFGVGKGRKMGWPVLRREEARRMERPKEEQTGMVGKRR
jgi:hypothetical protein